jgi:hypothetical protein
MPIPKFVPALRVIFLQILFIAQMYIYTDFNKNLIVMIFQKLTIVSFQKMMSNLV